MGTALTKRQAAAIAVQQAQRQADRQVSGALPAKQLQAQQGPRLPLQVGDELANGDLLRHLLVEVVAVEHHGLQDGQGPLQNGGVHARLVDETRNLKTQAGHGCLLAVSAAEKDRRERVREIGSSERKHQTLGVQVPA